MEGVCATQYTDKKLKLPINIYKSETDGVLICQIYVVVVVVVVVVICMSLTQSLHVQYVFEYLKEKRLNLLFYTSYQCL